MQKTNRPAFCKRGWAVPAPCAKTPRKEGEGSRKACLADELRQNDHEVHVCAAPAIQADVQGTASPQSKCHAPPHFSLSSVSDNRQPSCHRVPTWGLIHATTHQTQDGPQLRVFADVGRSPVLRHPMSPQVPSGTIPSCTQGATVVGKGHCYPEMSIRCHSPRQTFFSSSFPGGGPRRKTPQRAPRRTRKNPKEAVHNKPLAWSTKNVTSAVLMSTWRTQGIPLKAIAVPFGHLFVTDCSQKKIP